MKVEIPQKEEPLAVHQGIFRRRLSLFEGTALIVSGTIGAGILSIPYAVAQVGLLIGLAYIVVIGLLIMGLNLLIGEIAVRTNEQLQFVGFARKYLGKPGEWMMTVIVYSMLMGVLVIYIVGEGQALSALLGGSALKWSVIFFLTVAFFIAIGIRTIKTIEFVLSLGILAVVLFMAGISTPYIQPEFLTHFDLAHFLFPYGVILFAYHSTTSIPEAHSLLIKKEETFKKAIILSSFIAMAVYAIFAIFTVGVTGPNTTEIATIGLGQEIGKVIFVLGNIFAVLVMGTSTLMVGLSLRDSLQWDYKFSYRLSTALVTAVPLGLFLLGLRSFIAMIDIVGGVFVSLEMLLILLMYWRAKQMGHWRPGKYKLHHTTFLLMALLLALSIGAVYSVVKLF